MAIYSVLSGNLYKLRQFQLLEKDGSHPFVQIPGTRSHQQVANIAGGAFEKVPAQPEVCFQIPDYGFNGRTSATELPFLVPLVSVVSFKRWSR